MNKEILEAAQERIDPYIHNTPVLTSRLMDELFGGELFFKCENFQKMGAFKMRGAMNAILSLNEEEKSRGVVAHSSGNFAQAVSLSAQLLGVKAYIVMPENAPEVKKEAVRSYGGLITECGPTIDDREIAVTEIIERTNAIPLHPSNQDEVIAGNSSLAIELFDEVPNLDYVIAPVGGGGLLAGVALASKYFSNQCIVIGAEPKAVDDAFRSMQSGKIEKNKTSDTIADGLKTHLGDRNFPIIQKLVDRIVTVDEDEIVSAMKITWERLKTVIEPSAAVGVAVALKEKELLKNKKVGIVLCGGNVDLSNLPF